MLSNHGRGEVRRLEWGMVSAALTSDWEGGLGGGAKRGLSSAQGREAERALEVVEVTDFEEEMYFLRPPRELLGVECCRAKDRLGGWLFWLGLAW